MLTITDFTKELLLVFLVLYLSSTPQFRQNLNDYILLHISEFFDYSYSNVLYFLMPEKDDLFDLEITNVSNDKKEEDNKHEIKPEIKYEDKYLDDIRKMDKNYKFTEEENIIIKSKTEEFYNNIITKYHTENEELLNKIIKIETKLARYEGSSDDEYCDIDEDGKDDSYLGNTKEIKINNLLIEKNKIVYEYDKIKKMLENTDGQNEIIENATKKASEFIINERLNSLKDTFLMERTPLGNVLMFWNNKRETFEYYSDNSIPYRYLEVVARKYVKTFNCRGIYIDMEEELKISELRLKEEKEKKEKEMIEKKIYEDNNKSLEQSKKNVFAKFKSYNKEAGTGRVNTAPPPKNSIPNRSITDNQSNDNILLKDHANRYTYEGKLSNFKLLKRIDRKVVDKKYKMNFSDFKKMQSNLKNKI